MTLKLTSVKVQIRMIHQEKIAIVTPALKPPRKKV